MVPDLDDVRGNAGAKLRDQPILHGPGRIAEEQRAEPTVTQVENDGIIIRIAAGVKQ
jgi:hypothetical protein